MSGHATRAFAPKVPRWVALGFVALTACMGGVEARTEGADNLPANPLNDPLSPLLVTVEAPPAMDPVMEFPAERVWQEFWFPIENPGRDMNPTAQLIRSWVDARPGMVVADLGAGGGYYTFQLARAVGDDGHVWAVDVDSRMTRRIAWEAQARGVSNVTALRVQRGALGLAHGSIDLALMIDTGALQTCEVGADEAERNNALYVEQIARALQPGGRLIFMDTLAGMPEDPTGHGCSSVSPSAMAELARPRFELLQQQEISKGAGWRGYVMMFRLRDASTTSE